MARIVIRCEYSGNYVLSGFDTQTMQSALSRKIFCPYCVAEHTWADQAFSAIEVRGNEKPGRPKPQVRRAS
ncbi:MAG: hypothetical protein K2Z80_14760 [Xanthobacteraceae bacterium]|nr:hypothetical protein [Xanthobacteraceae bacterium]